MTGLRHRGPRWAGSGAGRRLPAPSLVAVGAVSVQFGAAIATHLFGTVGPAGAVTLRLVLAAAALGVLLRPRHLSVGGADIGVAVAFGVVMAGMNLSFYEAISRIPLGVAVTVEFAGPLAVTIAGSRRRTDLIWAFLAGTGVVLLAHGGGHHLDLLGLAMALLAGAFWAAYILLSAETGRRFAGSTGLAVALIASAVVVLPLGILDGGSRLLDPAVLGMGLAVALLSSVVPYSLELAALRRLTPRAFGVLLSMEPGVAAVAGLVVLGQHLAWVEGLALLLVVAANVGSTGLDARAARTGNSVAPPPVAPPARRECPVGHLEVEQ